MSTEKPTVLHLEVQFPDRSLAKPVLREISENADLAVNILRGRVSEEGAWFDVEVSGDDRRIEELLRLSRKWGADVHAARAEAVDRH